MRNIDILNYSILLVDDDSVCNFITKTLLNQKGFKNVFAVENGKEALGFLINHAPPQLIFLDINMPVMNGFEFLEKLESSTFCPKANISMLTSSYREEDVQLANSFGNVIAYLEKPLTENKVVKIVEQLSEQ